MQIGKNISPSLVKKVIAEVKNNELISSGWTETPKWEDVPEGSVVVASDSQSGIFPTAFVLSSEVELEELGCGLGQGLKYYHIDRKVLSALTGKEY
jgi:hypothetical protein